MNQIGKSLFSHSQQQILNLFFLHADRSFYLKEVIRKTHMGVASVKRELGKLHQAGILTRNVVGNQHHYQTNKESVVYEEVLSIVKKVQGLGDYIDSALKPVIGNIDVVYFYEQQNELELIVLSDIVTYSEIMDLVLPAETALKKQVNPTVIEWREWNKYKTKNKQIIKQLDNKETIFIKGSSSLLN